MTLKQAIKIGFVSKYAISKLQTKKGLEVEVLKGRRIVASFLIENQNDLELCNDKVQGKFGLSI